MMEKVCSIFCIVLGTVFLVAALCGELKCFVTMGICYATAFLVTEKKEH